MAAPSYVSDLTSIYTDSTVTTTWTSLTGAANTMTIGETDFFIQGTSCTSKQASSTSGTRGMIYNSAQTITSGSAVYMWLDYLATSSLAAETSGGLQVLIGSATNAYRQYYVKGNDTYAYGGWYCAVVDPAQTSLANATTGAPSSTTSYFGAIINIPGTGPSKGNPFGIDAIRWGRTITTTAGDLANGYATFAGIATQNDSTTNRWGQFQAIDGGYLMQGRLLFGTTGSTTVDSRDSNRNISIANTKKVASTFNQIEIQNTGSNIAWSNINISTLGTTSRGDFTVTDNATVALTTCVFTDMGTFGFLGNTTATTCTFRRCNLVTQSSSNIASCTFDSTNDATRALLCNDPGKITSCTFISGGTKHAIEFNTQGTYGFNNTFTGYASTDGTTGNEAVYNNCTPYNTTQTYASANQDSTLSLRSDAGGTSAAGECFASTATKILSVARFYLKKTGTPTLTATAKIYAVTGTPNSNATPTGSALATSDTYTVSNLTGSYQMISFNFTGSNCITLTSGTNYFVVLDVSGTTSSSGNTIDVGYDNSAPTFTAGNAATFAVGGAWSSQAYDLVFDAYTDGAVILNITGGTTPTIRNALGCSTTAVSAISLEVNGVTKGTRVRIEKVSDGTALLSSSATTLDGTGVTYKATGAANNVAGVQVKVKARKLGYLPFETTTTIPSGGLVVTAVWQADSISNSVDTSQT